MTAIKEWLRVNLPATTRVGDYQVRLNEDVEPADIPELDDGVAWEVWHLPTETVESNWFTYPDAIGAAMELARASAPSSDERARPILTVRAQRDRPAEVRCECGETLVYAPVQDRYACPKTNPVDGMGQPAKGHVHFLAGERVDAYRAGWGA